MGFELRNRVEIYNLPKLPYVVEEAVSRLRINIGLMGTGVKKIMVISSMPDEGKSFISFQLWRQMAEAGIKSLYLDLDLRKSVTAKKYQIVQENGEAILGTSHYLANDLDIEDCILKTYIGEGDLMVNATNVINPSTLITSERFANMMKLLEEEYRYVIVDSPPLNMVSDGEMIGSMCDGAVLVVRSGATSRRIIRNSMQQLERAGCPLLGVVLSRTKGTGNSYYYKKYESKQHNDKFAYGYYKEV